MLDREGFPGKITSELSKPLVKRSSQPWKELREVDSKQRKQLTPRPPRGGTLYEFRDGKKVMARV